MLTDIEVGSGRITVVNIEFGHSTRYSGAGVETVVLCRPGLQTVWWGGCGAGRFTDGAALHGRHS